MRRIIADFKWLMMTSEYVRKTKQARDGDGMVEERRRLKVVT
jgi:hypothetical protein